MIHMDARVLTLTACGICTLACRNALRKSSASPFSDILPAQGSVLFDLVLTLASGAATWFDLTAGKYLISILPADPSAKIQMLPEPFARERLTDVGGDVVSLDRQTRLTIANPVSGGEPEVVAVRIVRMSP